MESNDDDIIELVRWMDSPECSYTGIRDRLILGHRAMCVAARLPTFASYAASSVKAKLREARKAMEDMCASYNEARTQLSEEHASLEETRRKLEVSQHEAESALERERAAHGQALTAERERLASERARMSAQQVEVLARLADIAEARGKLEARDAEARARAEAREAEARARAESREAEAHARLDAKLSGIHSEEVRKLRSELDRLKGTNHVKGIEGESTVSSALRAAFDSWTFVDTSGSAGSSDFHMVGPKGETLVVEVKNKSAVTAQDVSKSHKDVAELRDRLGDAFLGYLFVSLRCRSIPGKGALHLEASRSASVPILWCGLEESESGADSRDVVRAARLLVDVGRVLAPRRPQAEEEEASSSELEEAMGKLNAQLKQLDEMRKIAARLSDSASVTRRHAASMQTAIDSAFASLDSYRIVNATAAVPTPAEAFECQKCGKVCSSKNGLATHGRFCR